MSDTHRSLRRELGLFGAVMLGLGSIVGTGVFVSVGIAAGVAMEWAVIAIGLAGILAACNALSSAQLAANHPTSGGTYEYGHVYLAPWLGFTAGWMFLCAKSASAAAAALGASAYALVLFGADESTLTIPIAAGLVVLVTVIVLGGMRRTNIVNIVIVSITLATLTAFVLGGLPTAIDNIGTNMMFIDDGQSSLTRRLLEATALMFVAYTGYGRIATLGEEVHEPRRTIPRAIIVTLLVSMVLYGAVATIGIGAVGPIAFAASTESRAAPLAVVARAFDMGPLPTILAIGAVTAMLGVLLNLILGLSRVMLAMGRRRDLPRACAHVHEGSATPVVAVLCTGAVILGIALNGNITMVWSFSAFTVLIYYAITNAAAIALPRDQRLYPVFISWIGLLGCLSLAWWVEPRIWQMGCAILLGGLIVRAIVRATRPTPDSSPG